MEGGVGNDFIGSREAVAVYSNALSNPIASFNHRCPELFGNKADLYLSAATPPPKSTPTPKK